MRAAVAGVPEGALGSIAVQRIAGGDRVATAIALSRAVFDAADTVVLARADDPADALVGAPLAARRDAPILLTPRAALPAASARWGRPGGRPAAPRWHSTWRC